MPDFGFVGPGYIAASVRADCQRAMNLMPEVVESGNGKAKVTYVNTPGLEVAWTLPTSPVRGLWPGANRLFAVAGSKLYELTAGGTYTDLGDCESDGQPVTIFANGGQLYVTSNGKAWCHTGTTLVAPYFTPPNATERVLARYGGFLDGYFIAVATDDKIVYLSWLNDGTHWDKLEAGTKEAYPDNIGNIITDHEALFVLGDEQGCEVWHNTGPIPNDDYPLHRDFGAFIHYCIQAPWSLVRLDDGVAWIGGSEERGGPFAIFAKGFMPTRVSTAAIESEWAGYSKFSDAVAYSAIENGHHIWVISFPTADKTWVYDRTESSLSGIPMWHERGYWNGTGWGRVRGAFHAFVGVGTGATAQHYVGDYSNGKIYRQSFSLYTDAGTAIHRRRTSPHAAAELKRLAHSKLAVEHKPGITPTLAWSNDGGETFSTPVTADGPLFAVGDPSKVVGSEWRRLGRARDRVYQFDCADAAQIALINGYLEAHP